MPTAGAHRELAIRRHPLRPPLRESVENILTAHPSSRHSTQFSAISTSATANEVTCATPALELYFLGLSPLIASAICPLRVFSRDLKRMRARRIDFMNSRAAFS